ncbi:hypothetical protein H7J07_04685 [Mycobacterium koreense]|uniref:Uncharacterized protein n=1 Tax=Mycolicibacillus koreensis TaxID=1069220 RepID=A0A7I7SAL2_9MYCO|nr:hypothetical protein [Mycolicibacillus koreensis]MCV7247553.1 hypothetical protein [Mycolicibacillus koreensis]OSC34622.1 hypothetical protein B8W67_06475 [Mycolicibacillus koreensis]BBY53932.1 hypothetical protein MKOR_11830 [Mycolicibacillus koreensis]
MTEFLLHPAVPSALLVVWTWVWWTQRRTPPLLPQMNRKSARPGDLSLGGSAATSKTEKRVRDVIERAGYRTYPQGTLMCMGRDSDGKKRFFTPDILVRRPFAVVEVDPAHWHGAPEKVAEDIMRNRFYAARGLRVVRVRIDGTKALSPNDVVIAASDFDPDKHGPAVVRALGSARMLPASYWNRAARTALGK